MKAASRAGPARISLFGRVKKINTEPGAGGGSQAVTGGGLTGHRPRGCHLLLQPVGPPGLAGGCEWGSPRGWGWQHRDEEGEKEGKLLLTA